MEDGDELVAPPPSPMGDTARMPIGLALRLVLRYACTGDRRPPAESDRGRGETDMKWSLARRLLVSDRGLIGPPPVRGATRVRWGVSTRGFGTKAAPVPEGRLAMKESERDAGRECRGEAAVGESLRVDE